MECGIPVHRSDNMQILILSHIMLPYNITCQYCTVQRNVTKHNITVNWNVLFINTNNYILSTEYKIMTFPDVCVEMNSFQYNYVRNV